MRIAPGAYSIGYRSNRYRRGGHSRAFLFDDGGELTLVDTLWDADARAILDCIGSIGRSPTDLKHIALTHAHRSHLGGLATLKRVSGAIVCAHEWEANIIEGRMTAQPVSLRPQRPLRLYPFRIGARLGVPKHDPCRVDRFLNEGDAVGSLRVLHTPGHTPGHIVFHSEDRGVLVAGDAVATWPRFDGGWPGFNLDEGAYRKSLRRLAELEVDVIGAGHGRPIVEGASDCLRALADPSRSTPPWCRGVPARQLL